MLSKVKILALASLLILAGITAVWLFARSTKTIPLSADAVLPPATNQTPQKVSPNNEPAFSPLTLEKIFSEDKSWTATISAEKKWTLLVTGDVLTARTVNTKTLAANDFTWAWKNIAEELRQADIAYINLETPLVENCPLKDSGMIFCGDVRHIMGLQHAGVDVVNLANNHMGNYGQAGVDTTVKVLENAGLGMSGVNGAHVRDIKGQTIAFLGYNEVDQQVGIYLSEPELIKQQVSQAKAQADVVVVQFHWGAEYTHKPTWNQKELARLAIDAGADLIVSNHPHWWQPVEFYKGKVIAYSHGNFIFDQMWSKETREGVVGKYTFYEDTLIDVEFLPILIENFGQPRWLNGTEKSSIIQKMKSESSTLINESDDY